MWYENEHRELMALDASSAKVIHHRPVAGLPAGEVPIQLAKKPLENPLEKPLEISYTGKTPKICSLDMSQNQIWVLSGFSAVF